jgi:hypothetical protein
MCINDKWNCMGIMPAGHDEHHLIGASWVLKDLKGFFALSLSQMIVIKKDITYLDIVKFIFMSCGTSIT